jgi:hypothetical protein
MKRAVLKKAQNEIPFSFLFFTVLSHYYDLIIRVASFQAITTNKRNSAVS